MFDYILYFNHFLFIKTTKLYSILCMMFNVMLTDSIQVSIYPTL